MNITQGSKQIEITIDSYEFPFDKQGMKEDNNWLNVKVVWEDEVLRQEGVVPCLLSYELIQMIDDIEKFLREREEFYVSDFLEPNLNIKLKSYEDGIAFYISFLFKHQNEPYVLVKQMHEAELQDILAQLKQMQQKFPVR